MANISYEKRKKIGVTVVAIVLALLMILGAASPFLASMGQTNNAPISTSVR